VYLPRFRVAILNVAVAACHFRAVPGETADAAPPPDSPTSCAPGLAGAPCVLALYDRAAPCSDPTALADLHRELDARAGLGPLWAAGRALFRTQAPANVAGDWNAWSTTALATAPLCGSDLVVAVDTIATGFYTYKLAAAGAWSLDPTNPAFAWDDFAGNPDGRNSVLDTPDSGRGHLVALDRACSTALGNCRAVTAYLPPGYDAPDTATTHYPVVFMHDGQNLWDDHDCCFGHTGWEINVLLDGEIAGKHVAPIVVIGADSTSNRNNEYGLDAATTAAFVDFQIHTLQPHALAQVRWDGNKVAIAGSSLGGLMAMELGLGAPDTYSAIGSLSGAFWPNNSGLLHQLPTIGKQPVAIYVDSGGMPSDNSDGAADTIAVRDQLVALGWQRGDSTACTVSSDAVCYYWEPGATHDELAWKARVWRMFRFLFPGT
jgi:predicted alpha/beta superfamily hydrolase